MDLSHDHQQPPANVDNFCIALSHDVLCEVAGNSLSGRQRESGHVFVRRCTDTRVFELSVQALPRACEFEE